ncbi:MAG: DNA-3-methyladenine glycosylase I [Anaerolineae bacterium]|nr:DNA-3-methyladenine glycosylase I [Anaerolineae bacterium]
MTLIRCGWVNTDPLYMAYHDEEWGVPLHDEHKLFEFLILEGMQAGLSWFSILKKRENFRAAFDHFDPEKVARYDEQKIAALMQDEGIIRNALKLRAAVKNAQAFLKVQDEVGSFDAYIWQFVGGEPKINAWKTLKEIPPETTESQTMSKDLKKRGFSFVGPVMCYGFMQATGMVNDHTIDCFRYVKLYGR